jgi:hypothetical protein
MHYRTLGFILATLVVVGCKTISEGRIRNNALVEEALALTPQITSERYRSSLRDFIVIREPNKVFAVDVASGRWGQSWNYNFLEDAKKRAIRHCGKGCRLLLVNNRLQYENFPEAAKASEGRSPETHIADALKSAVVPKAFSILPMLRIETGMHTNMINRMDLDPTGRWLISPSDDKTVRLWDLKKKELANTFRPPIGEGASEGMVQSAAISPDGRLAACSPIKSSWEKGSSIYVFNPHSGVIYKKISGLSEVAYKLKYSRDGRYLAAVLYKGGLRIFSTQNYNLVFSDEHYSARSQGVDFDDNKRLVTASWDGYIRLYSSDFKLLKKKKASKGSRPYHVQFSPDGQKIAVGLYDALAVEVLSGVDLGRLYEPDTSGLHRNYPKANLMSVCWSLDGETLYAGGRYMAKGSDGIFRGRILKWAAGGKGRRTAITCAKSNGSITSIHATPDGSIIIGTVAPSIERYDREDNRDLFMHSSTIDARPNRSKISLSSDGATIGYYRSFSDPNPTCFSITERKLLPRTAQPPLMAPRMASLSARVSDWSHKRSPKLNGKPLQIDQPDEARCFTLTPDDGHFLLGTERYIYLFDKWGRRIWRRTAPGEVWGLNVVAEKNRFVGVFADGTIRWFNFSNGTELLAFLPDVAGSRWVMWTPEGFFDHSPGGEHLIGYHVNVRPDWEAEFIDVSRLYNLYYRPDLVRKKFDGGFSHEISKELDRIGDIRTVIGKGLPPKVTVVGELERVDAQQGLVDLQVKLTDKGGGVGRVFYRLNGVTVAIDRAPEGSRNLKTPSVFRKRVQLDPGENLIQISAFNALNQIESSPANVPISAPEIRTRPGNLHILSVGINDYKDKNLALAYPVSDAQAVVATLASPSNGGSFQSIRQTMLLNEKATASNILAAFSRMRSQLSSNDIFVLYLAGHGKTLEDNFYYLTWEVADGASIDSVKADGISAQRLQELLVGLPAHKSLILIDTCQAGGFSDAVYRLLSEQAALGKLVRTTGRAFLCASTQYQFAIEGYRGHGLFTFTLIEGLEGNADERGDRNRRVSVNEVAAYVQETVPNLATKLWNYRQNPTYRYYGKDFSLKALTNGAQ